LVCGELARVLGLPQPEIVYIDLDVALARSEPDPEIQALIRASAGLNLALDFLPGSLAFDPLVGPAPDADMASTTVWFDAFIMNVDRTVRNTNLLVWHRQLWLIDNGAALYFQYNWADYLERSDSPFPPIKDHVLLPWADNLLAADERAVEALAGSVIPEIVALIPDDWLDTAGPFISPAAHRQAYVTFLQSRLQGPRRFVREAIDARARLL
jgi:hypothetical protein